MLWLSMCSKPWGCLFDLLSPDYLALLMWWQIHADETKSSLQFASRALCVTNCARVNEVLLFFLPHKFHFTSSFSYFSLAFNILVHVMHFFNSFLSLLLFPFFVLNINPACIVFLDIDRCCAVKASKERNWGA